MVPATSSLVTKSRFVPERPLASGTHYELVIASSLRDLDAMTLEVGLTVPFTTAVPSVTFSVEPIVTVTRPPDAPAVQLFVQVIARYETGAIATHFSGPVTVALESSTGGTLTGTTTVRAVEGIASFGPGSARHNKDVRIPRPPH